MRRRMMEMKKKNNLVTLKSLLDKMKKKKKKQRKKKKLENKTMTRSPILSYSKTVLSRGIKVFSLDLQWLSTDTLTGATSMVRVSLKLSALATKSLPLSAGATLRGNSWSQEALVTSLMICLMGGMITCRSNQWSGKSTMSRLGRRWRELFWSWWFYRACSVSAGAGAGTAAESSNRWRSGCALRSASQWRSTCSLAAQRMRQSRWTSHQSEELI